jgi:peptidoglycan/LPS O-acetylase OafA/YrhL
VKSHLPILDPLRFAAALGVAAFHQMFWSWAWVSIGVPGPERAVAADVLYPSAASFTWFGWVGVEIFFVISGFVIANSASQSSPGAFLLGRALRLYPAVWVCATATFLVLLLFGRESASNFVVPYIHAMLMVPKGVTGQWLDEVYWTLAAETAFYGLVFCAMLTRKITLRHLAFGLTLYSAIFNAIALGVSACTTPSDLPYLVILMFRVPCAAFLLSHGCFFALGIWLFISAHRDLTALERIAVAVTVLSGAAEISFFADFFLTSIPAIADQSALAPITVWAAAVLLIAWAARSRRRSTPTAAPDAPAYLRTLGLITYPLYLTHNVIGAAIIRMLVEAGLDATTALWIALSMLVLICWFICAKIEPAVRTVLLQALAHVGQLPTKRSSRRSALARGLRIPRPDALDATVVRA